MRQISTLSAILAFLALSRLLQKSTRKGNQLDLSEDFQEDAFSWIDDYSEHSFATSIGETSEMLYRKNENLEDDIETPQDGIVKAISEQERYNGQLGIDAKKGMDQSTRRKGNGASIKRKSSRAKSIAKG